MKKAVEFAGEKLVVRGLTWGEKEQLRDEGYNLSALDPEADNDALVERTIRVVCGDIDLSGADAAEVYRLFREIHRLTYLSRDEAKN